MVVEVEPVPLVPVAVALVGGASVWTVAGSVVVVDVEPVPLVPAVPDVPAGVPLVPAGVPLVPAVPDVPAGVPLVPGYVVVVVALCSSRP